MNAAICSGGYGDGGLPTTPPSRQRTHMHGAPARGAHLLLFILITTGTPVRACVCPGQYPRCDRSDGWCYNADDDYCGILHTVTSCFTFCGAKGGSTCTDSFLAPDVPTWSHVRILLTHWNDEAANVLEHLAWAAYEPSEKLVTWQCGPHCSFLSRKPDHIQVFQAGDLQVLMLRDEQSDSTVFSFRGTRLSSAANVLMDLDYDLALIDFQQSYDDTQQIGVHQGVYSALNKLLPSILNYLFEYHKAPTSVLFLTGHSLGAALATLAIFQLFDKGFVYGPRSLVSFASPRVGDAAFARAFSWVHPRGTWRVTRANDPVTSVPYHSTGYRHVGHEMFFRQQAGRYCCAYGGEKEDFLCSYDYSSEPDTWQHVSDPYMVTGKLIPSSPGCKGVVATCENECDFVFHDEGLFIRVKEMYTHKVSLSYILIDVPYPPSPPPSPSYPVVTTYHQTSSHVNVNFDLLFTVLGSIIAVGLLGCTAFWTYRICRKKKRSTPRSRLISMTHMRPERGAEADFGGVEVLDVGAAPDAAP